MTTTQHVTIVRVYLSESASRVETVRVRNIVRKRFGRLVVKRFNKRDSNRNPYWECLCDCGQVRVVQEGRLINGQSKSCGCLNRELFRARMLGNSYATKCATHEMSHTKIYHAWHGMINRCENPNANNYRHYGGRGIKVCKRWHKFENFYADMGMKPTPAHTLDRINNDGDYCKENCRWATWKEQAHNRRTRATLARRCTSTRKRNETRGN